MQLVVTSKAKCYKKSKVGLILLLIYVLRWGVEGCTEVNSYSTVGVGGKG